MSESEMSRNRIRNQRGPQWDVVGLLIGLIASALVNGLDWLLKEQPIKVMVGVGVIIVWVAIRIITGR